MSLEAWGDDGDAQELPEGCWSVVTVEVVTQCIKDLLAEPIYEGGKKENGVSVRFLARLTILQGEAELLDTTGPMYKDAEAILAGSVYALAVECPTCGCTVRTHHPAVQEGGEVQLCENPWHQPTAAQIRARESVSAERSQEGGSGWCDQCGGALMWVIDRWRHGGDDSHVYQCKKPLKPRNSASTVERPK